MNENLLDKVSTEKIEALINALESVIYEMISIEGDQDQRFQDGIYCMCLSLEKIVTDALKQRVNGIQGE